MQIKCLHKNIYKLERYARTQESLSQQALDRQKHLGDWDLLKSKGIKDTEIAGITGISRATYYRRKKGIRIYGIKGLEYRSRRPHHKRQSKVLAAHKDMVLKIRLENPTYGKAKIKIILQRDHHIILSESTVGRILKSLMGKGVVRGLTRPLDTRLMPDDSNAMRNAGSMG
ncbi:MAG: hypothetical protein WCG05_00560 [Alphaproteobacteria bacterium]